MISAPRGHLVTFAPLSRLWWSFVAAVQAAVHRARMEVRTLGEASGGPLAPLSPDTKEEQQKLETARANMQSCAAVVFDFLQSKGLFAAERALRTELEVNFQREASYRRLLSRNLWNSQIEKMLNVKLPRTSETSGPDGTSDSPEMGSLLSRLGAIGSTPSGGTPTNWHHTASVPHDPGASSRSTPSRRLGVRLHSLNPTMSAEEGAALRRQRSRSAQQSCVVFREGLPMSEKEAHSIEMLPLPLLYNPNIRGLEVCVCVRACVHAAAARTELSALRHTCSPHHSLVRSH